MLPSWALLAIFPLPGPSPDGLPGHPHSARGPVILAARHGRPVQKALVLGARLAPGEAGTMDPRNAGGPKFSTSCCLLSQGTPLLWTVHQV